MFLFILYLQNASEELPTGMKAQLVTSLDIAGSCVTFSERLHVILERLRFTFTADGKRQAQVENFLE